MADAASATYKGNDIGYQLVNKSRQQVKRFKLALVTAGATTDDTDTLAVTLADHGMSDTGFLGIWGFTHSTLNDVLVVEAPTTSVTAGVLTITVGGSTDNKDRSFIIFGEEA